MEALNNDIYKYSSIPFRNSLKVAKRLWIKYNLLGKHDLLVKLYPLFNSDAAKLNQIKEECLVINDILNRYLSSLDKTLKKLKQYYQLLKDN